MKPHYSSPFLACLLLCACGSEPDEPQGEDPAAHACEQVGESGTQVTATDATDTAPVLTTSEQPYTVTLSGAVAGYVRIDAPLDALLFTKTANVVTGLFEGTATTDQLPAATPNEDCPAAIPEHFDLELVSSGPWYLRLGPAAIDEVWLMLTAAGGHAVH